MSKSKIEKDRVVDITGQVINQQLALRYVGLSGAKEGTRRGSVWRWRCQVCGREYTEARGVITKDRKSIACGCKRVRKDKPRRILTDTALRLGSDAVHKAWVENTNLFRKWLKRRGVKDLESSDWAVVRKNEEDGFFPHNLEVRLHPRRITAHGETKTIGEWAKDPRCEVKRTTLHMRARRYEDELEAETMSGEDLLREDICSRRRETQGEPIG